jgi:hypothetical protein
MAAGETGTLPGAGGAAGDDVIPVMFAVAAARQRREKAAHQWHLGRWLRVDLPLPVLDEHHRRRGVDCLGEGVPYGR